VGAPAGRIPGQPRIAVLDCGVKYNILRSLQRLGCSLHVFPATTQAEAILAAQPDGVLLSNGPGDPQTAGYAVDTIRALFGKKPILGICLGHQLLGLAYGAKTIKLKFGHHGCNHPIKNLEDQTVAITSQNHNYAVDPATVDKAAVTITHVNLNDQTVAGMRHNRYPIISYQYHPEASPGPHDAQPIFKRFIQMMQQCPSSRK
jgi:carbamoyl-phosphate synthase small subunit